MAVHDDFLDLLREQAKELGLQIEEISDEARVYTAARLDYLATLVGQAGYDLAAGREALNILGIVAGRAVDTADAVDARWWFWASGALAFAARLVSPAS